MKSLLKQGFEKIYNYEPQNYFSCGGRFEILGNHTDHNHGKCLAGTCSLSIYASVAKRVDSIVRIYSEGFCSNEIDLKELDIKEKEKGTTVSLIRGIANYLNENSYKIGGFDIYCYSKIPGGAGVSSSAAFELLIAQIFNKLFNNSLIENLLLCKVSQLAERNYYGKMCGLLDQIGVGYGGSVYIDFKNINEPVIEPLPINLDGYHFLIINSGGSHAGLDHLYKAIPDDMFNVAKFFNKHFLEEVPYEKVLDKEKEIIASLGELPYLRAKHFYEESNRVDLARRAIKENDIDFLVKLMDESRISSTEYLQNMKVNDIEGSPLEACLFIKSIIGSHGSAKINGGGFAGSIICLIEESVYSEAVEKAKEKYGEENVYEISIRDVGPCEL